MLFGLLAGAAGTAALDLFSYGDMAVRGRAASELPGTVVSKLAERAHFTSFALATDDTAKNRRGALGAIAGYGVGLGSGVAYAAIRPHVRAWLPWPVAGVVLGLATLVASEGSATALGATDWRTWSASEWFADIVPRTIYGLTTAWVVEQGSPSDVAPILGTAATLVREETKILEPV
ncbi:MAG: hypothetical protein NVS4B5_02220 [Vulcanimicrobiaceae bacterium]